MNFRTPYRILVADDDADIRQLSCAELTRHGYEVSAVADGADAWRALNSGRFDLLVTDNSMPRMTGVELLQRMRAGSMPLPAILVSGVLPKEQYPSAPWLHPAAILLKPYKPAQLLALVGTVLRTSLAFRKQAGAVHG